jgi:hypothetical protein
MLVVYGVAGEELYRRTVEYMPRKALVALLATFGFTNPDEVNDGLGDAGGAPSASAIQRRKEALLLRAASVAAEQAQAAALASVAAAVRVAAEHEEATARLNTHAGGGAGRNPPRRAGGVKEKFERWRKEPYLIGSSKSGRTDPEPVTT